MIHTFIYWSTKVLSLDLYIKNLAKYIDVRELTNEELKVVCDVFEYFEREKHESMVYTILKLNKLLMVKSKTFERFNFYRLPENIYKHLRAFICWHFFMREITLHSYALRELERHIWP